MRRSLAGALCCSAKAWLLPGLLCLLPAAARADVWAYVDEQNVAHFAAEQVDARYELFFRGDASFDARNGVKPAGAATPRPVAVPTAAPKLLLFFELSTNYKAVRYLLKEASVSNNIDYELLLALIATESGFDARAVSPRGAVGLMQVMPATAQRYGVQGDDKTPVEKKLADPRTNIRTGARYLRDLLKMFPKQPELALAAYNAGEGAVQRAGNQIPAYRETQNYVKTVMQLYSTLKPPSWQAQSRNGTAQSRVRITMGGAVQGRGNMIAAPSAAPAWSEFSMEQTGWKKIEED
jgi:soluble lytic murein transglycosylase-like protein